ncbi:hypothetical protein COLU111180_05095 [Cohnella lubricantis]
MRYIGAKGGDNMRSIAVYCSSSNGASEIYKEAACALGRELAARGISLVYGGSSVGLMGVIGCRPLIPLASEPAESRQARAARRSLDSERAARFIFTGGIAFRFANSAHLRRPEGRLGQPIYSRCSYNSNNSISVRIPSRRFLLASASSVRPNCKASWRTASS